jgi:hypothetical protein
VPVILDGPGTVALAQAIGECSPAIEGFPLDDAIPRDQQCPNLAVTGRPCLVPDDLHASP